MRQQFLVLLATLCCVLALLVEVGADSIFPTRPPSSTEVQATVKKNQSAGATIHLTEKQTQAPTPPGIAIRYLGLYDGLLALSLVLLAVGATLSERAQHDADLASKVARTYLRVQNVVLLVGSLVDIILSSTLALLALSLLIGMVSLFLAAPFGTIAYLIAFGFFDTGHASIILTFALLLKIAGTALMVLAGQTNRRLLVRLGLSMGLCVLVAFLQAFPPGILVSIVDALTAIVIAIVALVFAVPVLFGSLIGVVKSLKV